jgi:hypothetical protein
LSVWPGQARSNAPTKRVIALAWAVDPLAFIAFFPPQLTWPDGVAPLPQARVSLLPHPDTSSAPAVRTLNATPNWLRLKLLLHGEDQT